MQDTLEFPLIVYIPGFLAFPETNTLMSLILTRLKNADVPM